MFLFFCFFVFHFNNPISSSICKLPIRSEIYNCTFKNTNKLSIILLFPRLADAAETKTEMVGRFNHPGPHVRDRVHVEFLSEVIEIEKRLLGGLGNTCDAVNVLVIYFVMFPFGNYQKSLQDRQNSRGSPAIRRPDLYSPAEVDKRFLTFENPVKAFKQPLRAHCISISVCFSTEQLTS